MEDKTKTSQAAQTSTAVQVAVTVFNALVGVAILVMSIYLVVQTGAGARTQNGMLVDSKGASVAVRRPGAVTGHGFDWFSHLTFAEVGKLKNVVFRVEQPDGTKAQVSLDVVTAMRTENTIKLAADKAQLTIKTNEKGGTYTDADMCKSGCPWVTTGEEIIKGDMEMNDAMEAMRRRPSDRVSGEEGIYRPRPYTYTYNDIRDKELKCVADRNREWHYYANNNTWECPLKAYP